MKPMKLTSLMVMLLVGFSAAAQEEFFDDVYFSSSKKDKKEKTEEKVIQPKEDAERTTMNITVAILRLTWRSRMMKIQTVKSWPNITTIWIMKKLSLPILKRNVVRIRNIPSVSSVTIRRARLRLPEQTKSICI